MKFIKLNLKDAEVAYKNYINNHDINRLISELNDNYLKIRTDLLSQTQNMTNKYGFDLEYALFIYEYFNKMNDFNISVASDYDFWRYICIKVVPDLIEKRHGQQPEYYYKKNVRIYLSALWWYIHLTYQGDIAKTKELLNELSTDYILQIVERPGKNGVFVEIMREIVRQLLKYPENIRNKKVDNKTLIRRIMIQNTAKCDNYNLIFNNEVEKYVDDLFKACNIGESNV